METETFERFMDRCLYDPEKGYYSRNIRGIGERGDFTTAPQLSKIPALAIGDWAAQAMRRNRTRNLIEIGPGLGTLAEQILSYMPFHRRLRTKLHLVESSPTLSSSQKARLGKKATYHQTIHGALQACHGSAVIYSNELVDAFPVRIFKKMESSWNELVLDRSGPLIKERFQSVLSLPPSTSFQTTYPDGQRVEIHDSYRLWLESWLPTWKRGEMMTIDYGDTSEHLYQRRPGGSIRGYLLQQRIEGAGVYGNAGLQDLTADVNFSDLIDWSDPWLKTLSYENFTNLLQAFSPSAENPFMNASGYFKVLVQSPRNPNPRAARA